jgi:hypothetical protein
MVVRKCAISLTYGFQMKSSGLALRVIPNMGDDGCSALRPWLLRVVQVVALRRGARVASVTPPLLTMLRAARE